MRTEVVVWAALALLLFAAEAMAPGAFMLWLGLAAAATFALVLLMPGMAVLAQVVVFAVLSVIAILIYQRWFRKRARHSDQPTLNRRAQQLVGTVVVLAEPIVNGQGRLQIADAFWTIRGPDAPAGTRVRIASTDGMVFTVEPAVGANE
ncbi:NfeD family protein [Solilutibacter silvestris]|uniref:Membrane protease activity regulation-related protein n=1 Tax=Solilutibacter silvestris TaxID=1645665 RepID=A0A2K1PX95_9GAMM|nr:NfeD family protein [Lysobacter silvestris]PNS07403.1 membrane protease activity regulation-related protein [Lysobacter silvestris]